MQCLKIIFIVDILDLTGVFLLLMGLVLRIFTVNYSTPISIISKALCVLSGFLGDVVLSKSRFCEY